MANKNRPIIALTMGDAAGIGPEVVAKALAEKEIYDTCCPLVLGDTDTMQAAIKLSGKPGKLNQIKDAGEANGCFGVIDIIDMHNLNWKEVTIGRISAACGRAAMEYIEKAARLAPSCRGGPARAARRSD